MQSPAPGVESGSVWAGSGGERACGGILGHPRGWGRVSSTSGSGESVPLSEGARSRTLPQWVPETRAVRDISYVASFTHTPVLKFKS